MILQNHFIFRRFALGFLFSFIAAVNGSAQADPPADNQMDAANESELAISPAQLAGQVREIARSSMISRAKKEKRISTAVRVAIVSDTAYRRDSEEILAIALGLTKAAARVAPQFAEVISNSVSFASAVSRIDGASGQIRTAAFAAARAPRTARISRAPDVRTDSDAEPARKPRRTVRAPRVAAINADSEAEPAAQLQEVEPVTRAPRSRRLEREEASPNSDNMAELSDSAMAGSAIPPKIMLGDNTSVDLTANLGIRHDDNIYVTSANKVGDTIFTLAPGVALRFGLQSLAHGSLNYNESFVRYASSGAPNISLGAGGGDFGYDNGSLILAGSAVFQQLNQNDNSVAALALRELLRRDLLDLAFSAETEITAKTRLKTGANFDEVQYKTAGLIGTQDTSVPLKVYFETTPKTSVSVGATYRNVKPQGGGPSGHDIYYNVGARGSFTSKLAGEFSVGYRKRDVGVNPAENLWGFDGNLSYEITPKTSLAILLSRDFSTGALGESLKTNSYSLKLTTDPTPQWSFASSASYQDSSFGPVTFSAVNIPVTTIRKDGYWQGNLTASYIFARWLTLTADYTLRDNRSTLPLAQYSNNILSLMLGLRY